MFRTCIGCGKQVKIEMTAEKETELNDPNRRDVINILPTNTPEEREMFISGICGECWDDLNSIFDIEDEPSDAFREDLDLFGDDIDGEDMEDM